LTPHDGSAAQRAESNEPLQQPVAFNKDPMSDAELRALLRQLDRDEPPGETRPVTKLRRLAVALNEWDYPSVSKIECGYLVQDANHVGDIELLLSDQRGVWRVTVRPSEIGDLITVVDPEGTVDDKRERELRSLFERLGYVYVPYALLQEAYPGEDYDTWFGRFFDWA
jgi:hypothetical protein